MIAFYNQTLTDKHSKLDNVEHYQFCCPQCIFRKCWMPGIRVTETVSKDDAGKLYGRKLTFDKHEVYVCTWMYDFGCPDEPEEDQELAQQRIESGWVSSPL